MSYLDIGLSALRANQVALQTVGHNIANAGTDGYHRQQVQLGTRPAVTIQGLNVGAGVDVTQIARAYQTTIESSLNRNQSLLADAETRQANWRMIETVLQPGDGSLDAAANKLFSSLEQLASQPQERALTDQFLNSAAELTQDFNRSWSALNDVAAGLMRDLTAAVSDVNRIVTQLVPLNERIQNELAQGRQPNDLLDQRDTLVSQLSQLIDVDRLPTDAIGSVLTAGGGTLVIARDAEPLQAVRTADGIELRLPDSGRTVLPAGGKLAGLLASLADVRQVQSDLTEWFESFRQEFDHLQATGLGVSGPFTSTTSTRPIASATTPLGDLSLGQPLQAGNLFVTVTDASQQRTTYAVSIDPKVDTLADVVARLDALPGVSAVWDPAAGRVSLFATNNGRLDFAGRLDQQPATTNVAGTATATIDGLYTGSTNATWRVTAVGSGEVGVTQPLRLEVRDASTGILLRTVEAGLGYEAGTPLDLGDGVRLRLSPGTLQAGDEWTVRPVAEPDETRFLAALGIQSFFTGEGPGTYGLNAQLLGQRATLAISRSGLAGETGNLARLLELRDRPLDAIGGETVTGRMASLLSQIGMSVQAAQSERDHLNTVATQWRSERDALSGVDNNEELLTMLQFQRAFQSASKYVSSVNDTMQQLLDIVR